MEQATIKSFWIFGIFLMEIAGTKADYWIQKHESLNAKGIILPERGNNGSDAYVDARNIISGYGFSEGLSIKLEVSPRNSND